MKNNLVWLLTRYKRFQIYFSDFSGHKCLIFHLISNCLKCKQMIIILKDLSSAPALPFMYASPGFYNTI